MGHNSLATAAGLMALPLSARLHSCHPHNSSARKNFLDLSQSATNALHLQPHCFRQVSSSPLVKCHRDQRNEVRPFPHLSQQHACRSASPGPGLDSQDVEVSRSSEPNSSTSYGEEYGGYAAALGGLGFFLACALHPEASMATATVPATGMEGSFPTVMTFAGAEPSNALSLPTWVIHVASVVEWVTAMALIWKYGDTEGKSAWKALTWGMVPLLGGAMCACTWHFFYNAESLEVLVVLQAFLTVVGNFTMWAAAYRIWKLSQEKVTIDLIIFLSALFCDNDTPTVGWQCFC